MLTSPGAHAYINLLQGIINRLAANSASCKNWCITLVSAFIVLAIDKGRLEAINLSLLPILVFYFLDSYYLSLERDIIQLQNKFVINKKAEDLFIVKYPSDWYHRPVAILKGMLWSFSTLPVYAILAILVCYCQKKLAS